MQRSKYINRWVQEDRAPGIGANNRMKKLNIQLLVVKNRMKGIGKNDRIY